MLASSARPGGSARNTRPHVGQRRTSSPSLRQTSCVSGSTLLLHRLQIDELNAESLPGARLRAVGPGSSMLAGPADDVGRSCPYLVVDSGQVHAEDPRERQVDRAEKDD